MHGCAGALHPKPYAAAWAVHTRRNELSCDLVWPLNLLFAHVHINLGLIVNKIECMVQTCPLWLARSDRQTS